MAANLLVSLPLGQFPLLVLSLHRLQSSVRDPSSYIHESEHESTWIILTVPRILTNYLTIFRILGPFSYTDLIGQLKYDVITVISKRERATHVQAMASQTDRKEIERLEDDNKVLLERLAGLENELSRRDKSLHELTEQKETACNELKEAQRRVKGLQDQLEETEDAEFRAKGN